MQWNDEPMAPRDYHWGGLQDCSQKTPCSISEFYLGPNFTETAERTTGNDQKLMALMESVVEISKQTQELISSTPIASDSRIPGITKMIKSEDKVGAPRGTYILMLVMRKLETILSIQANCLLAKSDTSVSRLNREIIGFLNNTIARMKKEFPSILIPAHGRILAKNKTCKKTYSSVVQRQTKMANRGK